MTRTNPGTPRGATPAVVAQAFAKNPDKKTVSSENEGTTGTVERDHQKAG